MASLAEADKAPLAPQDQADLFSPAQTSHRPRNLWTIVNLLPHAGASYFRKHFGFKDYRAFLARGEARAKKSMQLGGQVKTEADDEELRARAAIQIERIRQKKCFDEETF